MAKVGNPERAPWMRTLAVLAALFTATLTACAAGPQLGYNDYLANTNENPAWARNTQPVPADQASPKPAQP